MPPPPRVPLSCSASTAASPSAQRVSSAVQPKQQPSMRHQAETAPPQTLEGRRGLWGRDRRESPVPGWSRCHLHGLRLSVWSGGRGVEAAQHEPARMLIGVPLVRGRRGFEAVPFVVVEDQHQHPFSTATSASRGARVERSGPLRYGGATARRHAGVWQSAGAAGPDGPRAAVRPRSARERCTASPAPSFGPLGCGAPISSTARAAAPRSSPARFACRSPGNRNACCGCPVSASRCHQTFGPSVVCQATIPAGPRAGRATGTPRRAAGGPVHGRRLFREREQSSENPRWRLCSPVGRRRAPPGPAPRPSQLSHLWGCGDVKRHPPGPWARSGSCGCRSGRDGARASGSRAAGRAVPAPERLAAVASP